LIWLCSFSICLQMKVMKILVVVVVGFISVTVLVLEVVSDKDKRKLIIGTLCAVFAVGMYASPLTVMVS
jgi:solute carrier family 50 protein (sugar transporter)